MFVIPFHWNLERQGALPMVEATGTTPSAGGEFILLQNAVNMIEKAGEFKGIPYPSTYRPSDSSPVTVSCALVFPSIEERDNFVKTITSK